MKDTTTRLALRQTRKILSGTKVQAILLAVGLILGIAGPFDTAALMRLTPRIGYWLIVVVATFATGVFVHAWLLYALKSRGIGNLTFLAIAGLATGTAVTAILLALNWLLFGATPLEPGYLIPLSLNVMAVALIVSVVSSLNLFALQQTDAPVPPRLLERLNLQKRGAIVSLSVQDHYVQVTTTNGDSLLLMRLSDAIAETAPVPGLQVHRSHWVSLAQVTSVKRRGDKGVVTLRDGRDIPISRTYLKAVRNAGLMPG